MSANQTPVRPARAEPLLELMVDADRRGQVDSRTPVRWCVGRPMLAMLESKGFKDPYVVIVVRSRRDVRDYGYTDRVWQDTAMYVAPLTQEMQFIAFTRPGRNDLRAFVVEMNSDSAKWLRSRRASIGRGREASMFNDDGTITETEEWLKGKKGHAVLKHFDTTARQRVIVPAEMFASEPAQWRQNVVNAFFGSKGRDQCGFRRRFWFAALPATVLGVPEFFYLMKSGALLLYMFFGRLPNKGFWKTALNPFNFLSWTNALDGFSPSLWWHGKKSAVLGFLNPPVLLILPSAVFIVLNLPFHHYHVKGHSHHSAWYPMSWVATVEWVDGVLAALVLGIVALIVLVLGLFAATVWLASRFPKQSTLLAKLVVVPAEGLAASWKQWRVSVNEAKAEKRRQEKVRFETELAAMTCRAEAMVVDVSALPKEKQTIFLRFNDFKTKLCKPFAV